MPGAVAGRLLGWSGIAFAMASAAAFLVLSNSPQHDHLLQAPTGHVVVVSAAALAALVLAGATAAAAARLGEVRLVMLSLSFLSASGFFSVHGLATPGFIVGAEYFSVVGFSARIALLSTALFLVLGSVDLPGAVTRSMEGHGTAIVVGWSAVIAVYAALGLAFPESIPPRLMSEDLFLRGTLIVVVLACAYATWRYVEAYRTSGFAIHAAAALASVLLLEAQVAMHFGAVWRLSWWVYHVQLLGAYGALLVGVWLEAARGRNALEALRGMALRDALAQVEAGYSPTVRALAAALEARDPYTHGHGQRVAALAFYAAEQMGLRPREIRGIVEGALLHDLGKIGVSDAVLLKNGPLTTDEFTEIRRHPEVGEQMLVTSLSGGVERGVVRHHHEWFNGRGYPDGLAGDEIPLGARIVAVADVYDALRSNRAYRRAWTRDRTIELLRTEAGTHFDPACVDAVLAVADRFEAEFSPESAEQASLEEPPRPPSLAEAA